MARAEDTAIFHGFEAGHITGIIQASPHRPVDVETNLDAPRAVVAATEVLRAAGMNGPSALALGIKAYAELIADSEDGYPLRSRIEENLNGGSLIWAPALQGGAVLLSTRGATTSSPSAKAIWRRYSVHDRTNVEPDRVVHFPGAGGEGGHSHPARVEAPCGLPRVRFWLLCAEPIRTPWQECAAGVYVAGSPESLNAPHAGHLSTTVCRCVLL